MKNFRLLLVPFLALSLAACSSTSTSTTSSTATGGSTGTGDSAQTNSSASSGDSSPGAKHNVVIGMNPPAGPGLKGSGKLITVERKVEQFHAIELQDMAKVQITVGSPLKLSMLIDDNLAPLIDTKVVDGKLIISVNKDYQAERAPSLTVDVPELSEIYLPGSGDILVNAVKGDILKVENSGSGNCFAAGKVTNIKIKLNGSGNVDCAKVVADNVEITEAGSGNCKVNALKSFNAKLSGSGSIQYMGSPASLTKDITGSGNISPL